MSYRFLIILLLLKNKISNLYLPLQIFLYFIFKIFSYSEVNPPPRGLIHVSTVSGLPPRPPGPAAGANNNNNEGAGQGYVLSSPTMPTAPLSSQPSQKPVKKRATRRRATAAQQQLPLPPQLGDQRQQQQHDDVDDDE